MQKIIGTSAPLFCLKSSAPELKNEKHGTTATAAVFLKWLKATGQGAWQILPLSETHLEPGSTTIHVSSPYKGYGIGLDPKWLSEEDTSAMPTASELRTFLRVEKDWVGDYTLFCALRDRFGTDDWSVWEKPIRQRKPKAIRAWKDELAKDIEEYAVMQWRCHRAFGRLREAARRNGILIIGDLPFYIPFRSPLVWTYAESFQLEKDGTMERVSGLPNGPKAHFGRQVWGHPLYRWKRKRRVLALWKRRIDYFARFYDMMRLDHAKGFFHYGSMCPSNPNRDSIEKGPGREALKAIIIHARKLGLEPYAEDAGDRLEGIRETLKAFEVPGIRILRFAYNERRKSIEPDYANVSNYPENSLTVTSTHDTIPIKAYIAKLSAKERAHVATHVGIETSDDAELFMSRLLASGIHSPSRITLVQMQDWIRSEARINTPGTETPTSDPNWRYRMEIPIEKLPTNIF